MQIPYYSTNLTHQAIGSGAPLNTMPRPRFVYIHCRRSCSGTNHSIISMAFLDSAILLSHVRHFIFKVWQVTIYSTTFYGLEIFMHL